MVGKDVPLAPLQAIAGLSDDDLLGGLARLQAAEFLHEAALFPEPEYTFKHALTHEVVYGGLLQERRRTLHAHVVDAIEARYPDRPAEQAEGLAHHALRGEVWDKALLYARLAGERAAARSATRAVIAWFEQALAALARLPRD
nr:adenylate cyclase [Chloroflexota bacterium]